MDYSIGEFSKVTGLGIHTLRYYEHENLIIPLRNASNRRRYSEKDIAWIAFIKRLKATGMPIKEIKKYAVLRAKGIVPAGDGSWLHFDYVPQEHQVRTGPAEILCNISGDRVDRFQVEIAKVFAPREGDCRDYLIKVTDQRLLDATGGIVQGMSGSPILQNGKIVGAVTHVMVDDPASGYGIYVGRMLNLDGAA